MEAPLRSEYDTGVAQLLTQFKALEATHPRLLHDMRSSVQVLYTLFATTNHRLASR